MIPSSFADPDKDMAVAVRDSQIVKLTASGMKTAAVAAECGCDARTVFRVIKAYADHTRATTGDLVDTMFAMHQERLEALWLKAQARIDALPDAAPSADFCNAVRAAIMILERQSRLLGLDREKAVGGANKNDWLDTASEDELRSAAVKWGLAVPERIAG